MLVVPNVPVFGVFLAQRAIVCSHGRKPVEKIGPITPEPPQGAAERLKRRMKAEGGRMNEDSGLRTFHLGPWTVRLSD